VKASLYYMPTYERDSAILLPITHSGSKAERQYVLLVNSMLSALSHVFTEIVGTVFEE